MRNRHFLRAKNLEYFWEIKKMGIEKRIWKPLLLAKIYRK